MFAVHLVLELDSWKIMNFGRMPDQPALLGTLNSPSTYWGLAGFDLCMQYQLVLAWKKKGIS